LRRAPAVASSAPFRRRAVALTPLIDVIFLLLLFFMLSSTFMRFGEIEIAAAGGGITPDGPPPVFMQLRQDGVTVNGQAMGIEPALAELRRLAEAGSTRVVLAVKDGPTSQQLVDTMVAIGGRTGLKLAVIR